MFKVEYNPDVMILIEDIACLFDAKKEHVKQAVKKNILPRPYGYTAGNQRQVWSRKSIEIIHKDRGGQLPPLDNEKWQVNSFLLMPPVRKKANQAKVNPKHLGTVKIQNDWQ